jgi:hypothetical protein
MLGLPTDLLFAIHRRHGLLSLRNQLTTAFFLALISIFALAWWTVWKEKPSARGWGVAASLAYVLIYLQPIIFSSKYVWWHASADLFIGIVGLIVFSRHYEIANKTGDPEPDNTPS